MKVSKKISNLLKNAAIISSLLNLYTMADRSRIAAFKHVVGCSLSIFKPIPTKRNIIWLSQLPKFKWTFSERDMEGKETSNGSNDNLYCKKCGNMEARLIIKESIEQIDLPALILNFWDLYVEVHRMPPTLRLFKYRSFGHFILTSRCGRP